MKKLILILDVGKVEIFNSDPTLPDIKKLFEQMGSGIGERRILFPKVPEKNVFKINGKEELAVKELAFNAWEVTIALAPEFLAKVLACGKRVTMIPIDETPIATREAVQVIEIPAQKPVGA